MVCIYHGIAGRINVKQEVARYMNSLALCAHRTD